MKVFTCQVCGAEYTFADHHACLDARTARGLEASGPAMAKALTKADRNYLAKQRREKAQP